MKIAVTGSQGTLGREIARRGCIPIDIDVRNGTLIRNEIEHFNPDVLIHCAAITDVEYCENNFKESFEVNVRGTSNVVAALPKDSLFVYISSDHIFSGDNWFSSGYGEHHKPSPVNRYGFSKWAGELMSRTGICRSIVVRNSKCFNYSWAEPTIQKLNKGETVIMTDLIKRSFVHVNHFVDGLMYLVNNYEKFDEDTINISGTDVFSYYNFWIVLKTMLNLGGIIIPRREKLKEECPRPFRAGLNIHLAKKLGIPLFRVTDGIKLLKEGI